MSTLLTQGRKVRAPESSVAANSRPSKGEDFPRGALAPLGTIANENAAIESHRDESLRLWRRG